MLRNQEFMMVSDSVTTFSAIMTKLWKITTTRYPKSPPT